MICSVADRSCNIAGISGQKRKLLNVLANRYVTLMLTSENEGGTVLQCDRNRYRYHSEHWTLMLNFVCRVDGEKENECAEQTDHGKYDRLTAETQCSLRQHGDMGFCFDEGFYCENLIGLYWKNALWSVSENEEVDMYGCYFGTLLGGDALLDDNYDPI